jgi:hypothetical protein
MDWFEKITCFREDNETRNKRELCEGRLFSR